MRRNLAIAGILLLLLIIGGVVTGAVKLANYLQKHPPFQWHGPEAFENEPGVVAQQNLPYDWPTEVDPAKVSLVSFESGASIDSHSYWFRVELGPEEAMTWEDAVHARRAGIVFQPELDSAPEGVTRTLQGAIPLRRQTGATPTWWSPPTGTIRATEVMNWYADYDSGVGWAIYSIYDEAAGVLWVYDYSAQHDWLWEPGELPEDGEVIEEATGM